MDNELNELEALLSGMDIPPYRKNDIQWLARNLGIRNSGHPKFNEAFALIKKIALSRYKKCDLRRMGIDPNDKVQ